MRLILAWNIHIFGICFSAVMLSISLNGTDDMMDAVKGIAFDHSRHYNTEWCY